MPNLTTCFDRTSSFSVYEQPLFKTAAKKEKKDKKESVEERSTARRFAGGAAGAATTLGASGVGALIGLVAGSALGGRGEGGARIGKILGGGTASGILAHKARKQFDAMTPEQKAESSVGRPSTTVGALLGGFAPGGLAAANAAYYGQKVI